MTALFIILGILFLVFLPIINIYFPIGLSELFTNSDSKHYDLNPNKIKIGESIEDYRKRIQYSEFNKKPPSILKGFFIALSLLVILIIFIFTL